MAVVDFEPGAVERLAQKLAPALDERGQLVVKTDELDRPSLIGQPPVPRPA